ncbi:MAG: S41 family peptidase [Sphingomonadales bacterium]
MRKIALVAVVAFFAVVGMSSLGHTDNKEIYDQLDLFSDVMERIRSDYVEEVEDREIIEAAINGMLGSLDPHSSYMNADSFRNMEVQTRGQYGGLGMEVTMENGVIRVIAPIDDTPAARAGIQAGDYITHLDGEAVQGLTLTEAIEKMRGTPGTDIQILVARQGADQPLEITLTRAVVKVSSIRARAEGDVAYVRITSFNEQTEGALSRKLAELTDEIEADFKGVILDLRNNPGGLLDQAVAVTDAFLDHGEIVSTRGRRPGDIQRFNARKGDLANGRPIIVLINGGSASASEIVAGALQDHGRAIILGTRSFGKGSVQTIIPLGSQGALRLTTARYYTPSGRSIQAKGIVPDIEVEQATVEPLRSRLPRRSEANLRGHLDSPGDDGDAATNNEEAGGEDQPTIAETTNGDNEDMDYQLAYALDILRGLSLISSRTP